MVQWKFLYEQKVLRIEFSIKTIFSSFVFRTIDIIRVAVAASFNPLMQITSLAD